MRLCGELLGAIWVQEDSSLESFKGETCHSRKHGQRVQTLSRLVAPPRIGCLTAWYPVLLAGARGCRWMESDVHSRPPGLCHAQRPPSPSAALGTSGEPLVKAGEGAQQGCRDSSNAGQARPRWVSRARPAPCHSGGLVKGPRGLQEAPLAGCSGLRLIISPKPPPHCRLLNVRLSGRKCWHFSWCVPLSPCSPVSS